MTDEERGSLDFSKLSQFKPRPKARTKPKTKPEQRVIDQAATFPSREPPAQKDNEQDSLLIRANADVVRRFREIAKRDGLKLGGLLRMATEAYEQKR
jgi:hypothetical protein